MVDLTDAEQLVAEMKGIPAKQDLKKLLEEKVLQVTFTKLNGDQRIMTCTLEESLKPKATKDDPLSQKKVRETSDKTISVWDLKAQGWRSFRYDRVTAVEVLENYTEEK